MKGCIRVLKEQQPSSVEGLLNALRYVNNNNRTTTNRKQLLLTSPSPCRYTTKHLNDETTSKQIKAMLQPN